MRPEPIKVLWGLLLSLLLFSCSDDDNSGSGQKGMVKANIRTGIGVSTRAFDSQWEVNDAIGIAMMNANRTEIIDNIYNYRYYTPSGTESFEPTSGEETLYFPQDGSSVYFKSYYPYLADLSPDMTFPVSVEDQSNLPAIDAMTGEHLSGFSKADPNVHLRMHHRLSKLIFKYSMGEGLEDLPMFNSTVTIHGMETFGICDILNDTVYVENSMADILIPDRGDQTERTGIVLPRDAGEGVTFDFNFVDGSTFTAAMSDTLQLLSGHKYTFYITFEHTGVHFWVDIQDWIDTPPMYYEIINTVFPLEESEGVVPGDTMRVYLQGANNQFNFLDKFTYGDDEKWHSDNNIMWEDIPGESATFRASTSFANPKNDTQLPDILISDEVTTDRYHGTKLTFTHAGSRVVVNLASSTFTDEQLASATIELPNYLMGGHEENGAFVPGTVRGDILIDRENPQDQFAIIQPQLVESNADMVLITVDGREYIARRETPMNFEAGKAYLINITFNQTKVDIGVQIIPWEYAGEFNVDIQSIQVTGSLEDTDDFFNGKAINVYKMGPNFQLGRYRYDGQNWGGDLLYWDDYMEELERSNLTLSAVYAGDSNLIPSNLTSTNTVFPWNLPADQTGGYDNYDLLMDTVNVESPVMVNFHFQHVLSKVRIELQSNEFTAAELQGAEISLNNFILDGRASLDNGTVVATGARTTLVPHTDVDGQTFSALVMPQTIRQNTSVISIELEDYPNVTFNGSIQDDLVFEPGMETVIILTLEKTRIEISATLEEWQPGDTGQVVIQ